MRFYSWMMCLVVSAAWLVLLPAGAQYTADTKTGAAASFRLELPADPKAAGGGSLQFIGTATVLLRYGGMTILTDPNFLHKGDHVHLGYGLHAQRLTNPALELGQLPPIDLVILSHMHEDHFDKLVQQKLARDTPIVTTFDASATLAQLGFTKRFALARWDTLDVVKGADRLRVTATPGRHGGPVSAVLMPPVIGSILEFSNSARSNPYRMYISGDTLVFSDIAEIPRRFPDIDLALLHLGGTRVLGVKVTMDGKDGVQMMRIIAPHQAIPIHYNDYDVFKSPLGDFEREVANAGLAGKVTYLKPGETYQFAPARP
jgi:L-ascorbate metabolism protein UlaG (beta-lactamase superfamily)